MRRVLIIDTETTGTDPATDRCIEVAAVVYDVAHAAPVVSFSALLRAESNAAERVNRIPAALLPSAPPPEVVWERVAAMAAVCDAILAHNAPFDRAFVPAELRHSKPWICTMADLEWPRASRPGRALIDLALDHGLGVSSAHRAAADCDLIVRLLSWVADYSDLAAFLARGLRPKATFQALVSFDDREKAKAAGFQWEPTTKRWLRSVALEDANSFPFPTRKVA